MGTPPRRRWKSTGQAKQGPIWGTGTAYVLGEESRAAPGAKPGWN